jgi:alpha-glucosidase
MDGNGDGNGDIPGLTCKLDYFCWLGVDILWLSPIFPSPMVDLGYDVSDYSAIHPLFGSMEDFNAFLADAHRRGLKVLLDFVPNHTSDRHPWFIESRASRGNPRRNWYLWHDSAPDGGPPNNWVSHFGGSAWEWDEQTRQYYYHAYLKEQPDLNWRNPKVKEAMFEYLRFWLKKGVDGFRLDAVWNLVKDDRLRDDPPNPDYRPGEWPYALLRHDYSCDRPEIHPLLAEMRSLFDSYGRRLLMGEIYLPPERLATYYGGKEPELHLPCNFQLVLLPWEAETIARALERYEAALPPGAWPNHVLGNHDKPRVASRLGERQARVAAMLLLTLRGTPTIYYGEEIGMHNVPIPQEKVCDPLERNIPGLGRDPVRTPMQWDGTENAGFSTGEPWLPLSSDFLTRNVEEQRQIPDSLLNLYRRLITLRRKEPVLMTGGFRLISSPPDLLAFYRFEGESAFLVLLNFGQEEQVFRPKQNLLRGRVVLSTGMDREGENLCREVRVRRDEGVILKNLSPGMLP